jgi:lipid A 3-O-deacylase
MNTIARFGAGSQMVGLSLLFLTYAAPAQEFLPPTEQNGTWDISVWISGATGEETRNSFTQAQIWTAGVFIGKVIIREIGSGWRRGSLEYGFELVPVFVQSKIKTVYGGGLNPVVFRWNSGHHIGRVVPYIELAGGGVATTSNVPPGDTSSFNFTARGGGGIHIFNKHRQSWDVGCRWLHVSNANLGVRNPEFNGVQITLGYHWFK